jgi:hypothetical protein
MSKKNNKKGGKGGFGKVVVVMTLLLGLGGAAVWFLAPEQAQVQLNSLKNLLGL